MLQHESLARQEPVVQALLDVPGIGLLTATALFATVADSHAFKSGRQLACWLDLTPREFSSGRRRRLGRISKQGDPYVRMLLVHGARAALNAATRRQAAHKPLTQLQAWSLKRARESHRNKATVALANKLARIAWAVWYHSANSMATTSSGAPPESVTTNKRITTHSGGAFSPDPAHSDHVSMAERSVRHRDKADNSVDLRGRCHRLANDVRIPWWPGAK